MPSAIRGSSICRCTSDSFEPTAKLRFSIMMLVLCPLNYWLLLDCLLASIQGDDRSFSTFILSFSSYPSKNWSQYKAHDSRNVGRHIQDNQEEIDIKERIYKLG